MEQNRSIHRYDESFGGYEGEGYTNREYKEQQAITGDWAPLPNSKFGDKVGTHKRPDKEIKAEIYDRLKDEPGLSASGITVQCEGGTVRLLGFVSDSDSRKLAEQIVALVPGVTHISTELKLPEEVD